jgi:hypothetical protein
MSSTFVDNILPDFTAFVYILVELFRYSSLGRDDERSDLKEIGEAPGE